MATKNAEMATARSTSSRASDEKARVSEAEQIEEKGAVAPQPDVYNPEMDVSGVDERKLLRKIDLHLIPWLSILYLLSFLDRTSIGNAKVRVLRPIKAASSTFLTSST